MTSKIDFESTILAHFVELSFIESFIKIFNLFTTSDPPKYSKSNSPNLCFCLLKGDKKTFSLVQKIFSNKDLENSFGFQLVDLIITELKNHTTC